MVIFATRHTDGRTQKSIQYKRQPYGLAVDFSDGRATFQRREPYILQGSNILKLNTIHTSKAKIDFGKFYQP